MSLIRGSRADLFADLLDAQGRTDDPEVAPALALATALRAVPAAGGPRPEFRDALRQRLVAVASVQGVGATTQSPAVRMRELGGSWRFQRRMAVLAGSAAAITAFAGVGLGASRSLPGDPLYGMKRASEDVQLAVTFGDEAKGKRHLEFARTRLSEVEALVGRSSALSDFMPGAAGALGPLTEEAKTSTILATLRDMDSETRSGADTLVDVATRSGSLEPLRALDEFTQEQFADIRDVLPALPEAARPRARMSLSLLAAVAERTVDIARGVPGAAPGQDGQTPTPTATLTPTPGQGGSGGSTTPTTGTGPDGEPTSGSQSPGPTLSIDPSDPVPTIPTLPSSLPPILPSDLPTLEVPVVNDIPSLLGG